VVWSQTQLVWTKLFPHHQYHIIIIIIIIIITITIIILTIIFRPGLPSSATRPELESLATRVHPFISASQGQPSTLSSQSPLVQNRQIPFSSLPTTQTQNPKSRLSREPHTTRHGAFLSTSLHPPKIKNQTSSARPALAHPALYRLDLPFVTAHCECAITSATECTAFLSSCHHQLAGSWPWPG